jgi:hypothetical protein
MPDLKPINKRSDINQRLAEYFLSLEPGLNIESVRDLAASLDASVGLISESIAFLESSGAISIERRGQLGSFLTGSSIGALWNLARSEPLVISHTLPSNRRYEGLATALKKVFNEEGIDTYFIFIRGSKTRLNSLREKRCTIAIVSQFAAEGLKTRQEQIAAILHPGSFLKSHQVFYRSDIPSEKKPLDVAIDPDSFDQTQLSNIEFKSDEVNYQRITFMNIHHYLATKKVDLAIWTEEDMQDRMGESVLMRPLSEPTRSLIKDRNTRAALVIRAEDQATCHLINKLVNADLIASIQNDVVVGSTIPEY